MRRRFFISPDHLKYPVSKLTGQDLKHAKNVLRLKPGDEIVLFDGSGAEHVGRILEISTSHAVVEMVGRHTIEESHAVEITIAQAFLKDKKMDVSVRQLTELGIHRWQPFFSKRSVPKPDGKRLASRAERWEKIAREASKQCGRSRLPEIGIPLFYDDLLKLGQAADAKIIFWECAAEPLAAKIAHGENSEIETVFAIVGPEGGFEEKEVLCAAQMGFSPVGMGPRILRAETAALTAATLMQFIFGDMG